MWWNTIIFDLDGTLLNSLNDIANSANHTMRKLGFPERSLKEIKAGVGNGVAHLIECCLPEEQKKDKETAEKAVEEFRRHYVLHSTDETAPYDGIEGLLDNLAQKGLKTAVVSNKPDEAAQKVVRSYFGDKITYISGEREGVRRKPAPDLIYEAMEFLGSSAGDSVYVGDSEVDVLTARNAGLPVILVSWGYRSKEMLETLHADHMVDEPGELEQLLLGESNG